MTLPQVVIKGSVVVQGVPEAACFTTFSELLNSLNKYLSVEIAASSVSNVIISNIQPGALEKNDLWVRLSNSGSFIGLYMYSGTKWIQVLPAPQQIFWLYGSSASPPAGFKFVVDDATIFTAGEYAALIAQAILAGGVGPDYVYYPAVYIGT